jgi:hypothetical protein
MAPVQTAVEVLVDIAPVLPQALGADGPRRYLIAIGNQAEMRASFGAPLSLLMVEFDDGRISIPIKGQTSTELFPPLNARVNWFGPAYNPFFQGNQRNRPFVVTNTHPNMLFQCAGDGRRLEGRQLSRGGRRHHLGPHRDRSGARRHGNLSNPRSMEPSPQIRSARSPRLTRIKTSGKTTPWRANRPTSRTPRKYCDCL